MKKKIKQCEKSVYVRCCFRQYSIETCRLRLHIFAVLNSYDSLIVDSIVVIKILLEIIILIEVHLSVGCTLAIAACRSHSNSAALLEG